MRISDDRIRHFSHLIVDAIYYDDLVDYESEEKVVSAVKRVLTDYFGAEDEISAYIRKKIASLKKVVPQGSREYEILYRKYYEEEMNKRGR